MQSGKSCFRFVLALLFPTKLSSNSVSDMWKFTLVIVFTFTSCIVSFVAPFFGFPKLGALKFPSIYFNPGTMHVLLT